MIVSFLLYNFYILIIPRRHSATPSRFSRSPAAANPPQTHLSRYLFPHPLLSSRYSFPKPSRSPSRGPRRRPSSNPTRHRTPNLPLPPGSPTHPPIQNRTPTLSKPDGLFDPKNYNSLIINDIFLWHCAGIQQYNPTGRRKTPERV